jgi:choline dehydrogenase-like flavoprotein
VCRALRRLGLFPVPGPAALSMPGSDFHYAGTLPMGAAGPLATTESGELAGARGLFIVDGACLPRLPAKPPTITAMANAARIAAGILSRGEARNDTTRQAERTP